jgi:CBS-domain-containing membrane protein
VALQATRPNINLSRPWNVFVGQLIGLGTGMLAVYVTGAVHVASYSDTHSLAFIRVAAAVLAVALGLGIEFVFKASHAPAAATALLVALGLIPPNWDGVITVVCGIVLVTLFGEGVRRLQLSLQPKGKH